MTDSTSAADPAETTPPDQREADWRVEDLLDLYVRPARFFASRRPFIADTALAVVAWLCGMNSAIGRIEQRMIREEAGGPAVPSFITESWIGFWITVLLGGLLSALLLWHLGAWWYRVRLNWSGADEPHSDRPRVVYLYSGLVWAVPVLLTQVIDSFRFADYSESWYHESLVALLLLVFPFWSFLVSYRGIRTVFTVRRAPALVWFLILPSVMFLLSLGVFAALAGGAISTP